LFIENNDDADDNDDDEVDEGRSLSATKENNN